jgi:hypothetical protein
MAPSAVRGAEPSASNMDATSLCWPDRLWKSWSKPARPIVSSETALSQCWTSTTQSPPACASSVASHAVLSLYALSKKMDV